MVAEIGETAGKVWQALSDHGEADIARLVKLVGAKEVLIQRAIGWLAREDKIAMFKKGNRTVISLIR